MGKKHQPLRFSLVWCHFVNGSKPNRASHGCILTADIGVIIISAAPCNVKLGIRFLSHNAGTILCSNIGPFPGVLNHEYIMSSNLQDEVKNKVVCLPFVENLGGLAVDFFFLQLW